ncbi:MAG: HAMP domain-containing protein [Phycisphaerae bacterium]|nr:HAMP domain-containing protein [Phycisphaerae bacterium]
MRSLFFKLFAWFWLANILTVGILVVAIGPPRGAKPDQFRAMTGDALAVYGGQGLEVLRVQGPTSYDSFRSDLEERTGFRLFIVDEAGVDVRGHDLAPAAREVAQRARSSGGSELEPHRGEEPIVARRGTREVDQEYVYVARLRGPPSRFFASPYRTLVRVLAAVTMAGLLCYGLAHYLTAPMRNLRCSVRELAGGNLDARVGSGVESRRDEIGDLGRDFNFMAERIESLVSSQRRLVLDMSHELRSPLARLNLALGLAVQRAGPDARSALDRIGREAERLNDLIERMLVLSRLEHRETAGECIDVDVAAMMCDIAADAQFEARAHHRDAKLVRCDYCVVSGVPHLLRSAIDNVVRNALRHTPEDTTVEMSLEVVAGSGGSAAIRVRDRGPGVPDESLEWMFRPFCRVGEDRNRRTGGVGLGLAIARQAVKLHGGGMLASNAPDGGLIVEIILPLSEDRREPHGKEGSAAS